MDFQLSEDQLSIQSIARDFAQKRIAPVAADFDKSGEFPLENIREMGQLGLMGIEVPTEYGGAGMDSISYVLAMIEIAAADCAHSTIMIGQQYAVLQRPAQVRHRRAEAQVRARRSHRARPLARSR